MVSFNNIYNINWKRLVAQLTIKRLRKTKHLAWLNSLITPLAQLTNDFQLYRNYVNYRIGITPQVCYLEKLLNDRFDILERRIRIVKPVVFAPLVLFTKDENKPAKFYRKSEGNPVKLYTKAETSIFTVDFIVEVPVHVPVRQGRRGDRVSR